MLPILPFKSFLNHLFYHDIYLIIGEPFLLVEVFALFVSSLLDQCLERSAFIRDMSTRVVVLVKLFASVSSSEFSSSEASRNVAFLFLVAFFFLLFLERTLFRYSGPFLMKQDFSAIYFESF